MEKNPFEMGKSISQLEAERFFKRVEKNFINLNELAKLFSHLQQASIMCENASALAVVSFGHNKVKLSGNYALILSEEEFFHLVDLIERSTEEKCELLCLNCVKRKGRQKCK